MAGQNRSPRSRSRAASSTESKAVSVHETLDRYLLQLVDLALAGVILFAPLLMGGRHPIGRLVLVSIVCVAAVAWALRQCLFAKSSFTRSTAEWIILAGVAIIAIQLMPLPQSWQARLSPAVSGLLPLWTSSGSEPAHLGHWPQISLTPGATRGGLVIFLAYALLFWVTIQRIRTIEDVQRLLRWIAISATGMAALGLFQYVCGNGRFMWVYDLPVLTTQTAVKGSFVNPNHFTHFLMLGIGPLLWWTQSRLHAKQRRGHNRFGSGTSDRDLQQLSKAALVGALGLVALAGLLSFSRGGVAVLVLAAAICVGIYAANGLLRKKSLIAMALAAAVVGVALFFHGSKPLAEELDTLGTASSLEDLSAGRHKLWTALMDAIPHFSIFGSGIGSHREVYPIFFQEHSDVEFTHAENGPLQILLEAGIPGVTLLVTGISLCGYWCVSVLRNCSSSRTIACMGAVIPGLVGSVAHSAVDFAWYIPACMSLTVILAACANRLAQMNAASSSESRPSGTLPRAVWIAVAVTFTMISLALVKNRIGPAIAATHWDRYILLSRTVQHEEIDAIMTESIVESMILHLTKTLQAYPQHARANLRLANNYLRRFHLGQKHGVNNMPLGQIRDAALASNFSSRKELDEWLARAVGENRKNLDYALFHTRRGLNECPLQGDGYLYLAQLEFLEGKDHLAKESYLEQARKVRPYSDDVFYFTGIEAATVGDQEKAILYLKKAFHQGPQYRERIIGMLASQVPANEFIEQMQPDVYGLQLLYRYYRSLSLKEQARYVAPFYLQQLEAKAHGATAGKAAKYWYEAHNVYRFLEDNERIILCARKAVELAPHHYDLRHALAHRLVELQLYDEAVRQLQWCVHRRPDDQKLRRTLQNAMKHRIGTARQVIESQKAAGLRKVR